ncbi:hypothetical protein CTAYLR_005355 [Chrysophaeum taylorii]|uniref:Alpha-type protein kinase domain-containing protein n=1 Tax=Chrysophaeum taylorii TaxID=2483200 RepID=A0AAD7U8V2_9STRA|nr:hypothetical protein CTAYLR_005355 [Chrysophaeum taylorii]
MAREQLFECDPLASHELASRESEVVLRHRWIQGKWVIDVATLKVEATPFAEGSMRTCYLAKKMSSRVTMRHVRSNSKHAQWAYQRNYVLKTYRRNGSRQLLEEDVVTQAESKALARRYNAVLTALLAAGKFDRRSPKPMKYKCVDMLEPSLVVFPDRGDACFFMEAYIAGDFRKYNDNAGYVGGVVDEDTPWRATPQAFSHFTFCAAAGERIVVDIQGVGDLFTDPQIHTRDGLGFGVGNGGSRGIALFFATHRCNRVCRCMRLAPFATRGQRFDLDTPRDRDDWLRLDSLEAALDDYGVDEDPPPESGSRPRALGACLEPPVADALRAILRRRKRRKDDDDGTSSCRLYRDVHKTLGFMLLDGDDAILPVASPAGALYHLAAATLGGDPTASSFIAMALDAYAEANAESLSLVERARNADRARQAAAVALMAYALHSLSSFFLR